jgi:predicted nucleotidyltransferase
MQPHQSGDESDQFAVSLRDEVLRRLKNAQSKLRGEGIRHAAIFGSVARCEAVNDSDVDILVELDPSANIDLFEFVGLQQRLAVIMERDVDLVSRRGLRPRRHDSILEDAIEAF